MVEWLNNWAQGIIVSVIIATIIEMILPNGSSKKYVKVVVGLYILFTIISPAIKKFTSKDFNVNDLLDTKAYEEQMAKSDEEISKKIEENNNRTIKDIYQSNLESDIKAKLKDKGYDVLSTYIQIRDDENYTIEFISLSVDKEETTPNTENSEKSNTGTIQINEVEEVNIQIGENTKKENNTTITSSEKQKIAQYISSTYDISIDNIEIL